MGSSVNPLAFRFSAGHFSIPALPFCYVTLRGRKSNDPAYPENPRTLGEHLRKRRMDLGLLQRDVAATLRVDTTTIVNWENGHSEPTFHSLPAIHHFLGYVPSERRQDLQSLGERLVQHRMNLGWGQKRAASYLSVDPSTLAKWERDERVPRGRFLEVVRNWLSLNFSV